MLTSRFKAIPRAFGKNLVPRLRSQPNWATEHEVCFAKVMLAIVVLVDFIADLSFPFPCLLFSPGQKKFSH